VQRADGVAGQRDAADGDGGFAGKLLGPAGEVQVGALEFRLPRTSSSATTLYEQCRERGQREASPTAAIIDSQSVKSVEKGAFIDSHGYDAGKKIKGKKERTIARLNRCRRLAKDSENLNR
jgi:hypothetical protein